MEKRKKDRIWYLECLRVLAMLSVISFHVSKTALSDFSFSLFTSSCLLCVRNLVHYAVPIFFMISGALLLNPNKNLSIERLCKQYLIKYLLITVLFGGVYSCLEQIFDKKTISWPVIRSGIDNMIHGDSWAHMWYMYTLIWVMMLLPVLRLIVYKFKKEEIKYTIVVIMMFVSFTGIINAYSSRELGITYPINFIYCFYMLVGYWIHNNVFKFKEKTSIIILVVIIFVLCALAFMDIYNVITCEPWIGNQSPLIVLYSILIFNLGHLKIKERAENKIIKNIVTSLSENSFLIYLLHMFWINILYKWINFNPFSFNPFIGFITIFLLVLLLSYVSSLLVKKIPIINKLF